MKKCDHCKQLKSKEEFHWKYKALRIRHNTCKECAKIHNKKYFSGPAHDKHLQNVNERKAYARQHARDYVIAYLLTHPCEGCGESDIRVLEFHHVRGEKYKAVAYMVSGGYSIERIQGELDKCQVLCANCHRKITNEEKDWYRGRQ